METLILGANTVNIKQFFGPEKLLGLSRNQYLARQFQPLKRALSFKVTHLHTDPGGGLQYETDGDARRFA